MLTILEKVNNHTTITGLSTDTKPVIHSASNLDGAYNGDIFIEMDTKKIYMFDETGNQWREQ